MNGSVLLAFTEMTFKSSTDTAAISTGSRALSTEIGLEKNFFSGDHRGGLGKCRVWLLVGFFFLERRVVRKNPQVSSGFGQGTS